MFCDATFWRPSIQFVVRGKSVVSRLHSDVPWPFGAATSLCTRKSFLRFYVGLRMDKVYPWVVKLPQHCLPSTTTITRQEECCAMWSLSTPYLPCLGQLCHGHHPQLHWVANCCIHCMYIHLPNLCCCGCIQKPQPMWNRTFGWMGYLFFRMLN